MKLKHLKRRVWCDVDRMTINIIGEDKTRSTQRKRIRCPECGQSFLPRIRSCGDYNCWHVFLPPHKKIVKVPRKN